MHAPDIWLKMKWNERNISTRYGIERTNTMWNEDKWNSQRLKYFILRNRANEKGKLTMWCAETKWWKYEGKCVCLQLESSPTRAATWPTVYIYGNISNEMSISGEYCICSEWYVMVSDEARITNYKNNYQNIQYEMENREFEIDSCLYNLCINQWKIWKKEIVVFQ